MAETNKMLEETANYLLNHCFLLGGVEDQRSKYLYVQDHLNEVRAVFAPLGYAVLLYPAPLQAAALVNEHEGSQARLLKYESILLLVLRLLYLQKRESLSASADQVLVTVEEVQTELQKMNLPRRLDQRTLEELMRTPAPPPAAEPGKALPHSPAARTRPAPRADDPAHRGILPADPPRRPAQSSG